MCILIHTWIPFLGRHPARSLAIVPSTMVPQAGVGAIYGLVVSVLIGNGINAEYTLWKGFLDLGSGAIVGGSGIAAGWAIGVCGETGMLTVRSRWKGTNNSCVPGCPVNATPVPNHAPAAMLCRV